MANDRDDNVQGGPMMGVTMYRDIHVQGWPMMRMNMFRKSI